MGRSMCAGLASMRGINGASIAAFGRIAGTGRIGSTQNVVVARGRRAGIDRRVYAPAMQPIRIVLQTGASARIFRLFSLAFAFATGIGSLLIASMLWADAMPAPHRYVLPLVPLIFFVATLYFHLSTWRSRATDARLDAEGIEILGGRNAGLRVPWTEVDPAASRVVLNPDMWVAINGSKTYQNRLILGIRGGEQEIASSLDPVEQLSFAAVVASVRQICAPPEPVAPSADDSSPQTFTCAACGSPLAPVDAAEASCWSCGSPTPVSEELRERLRLGAAVDDSRRAIEEGVGRLMHQPDAHQTNRWLAASLLYPYLVPILLCAGSGAWITWLAGAMMIFAIADLDVAKRLAFPGLSVVFAARPGVVPQAPLRCRSCGGPLPEDIRAVTPCPWCEAENIRGLVLERSSEVWLAASESLGPFVEAQTNRGRMGRRRVGFWALVAAVGAIYALFAGG